MNLIIEAASTKNVHAYTRINADFKISKQTAAAFLLSAVLFLLIAF